jgi:uncharacterized SAM-binding protein YcdF (DUF218 family)
MFSKILKILFILIIFWIIGFCVFVNKIITEKPIMTFKSDAIVVLTGGKGRIDAGIELLFNNYAEHLFISGVGKNADLKDLAKYLESFTPEQVEKLKHKITLGHFASSTEENALETKDWIEKHKYKNIILVTSNYHMTRSLYLFKFLIPKISITPYSLVKSSISLKVAFIEYNKYLLYVFRLQFFNFLEKGIL